MFSEVGEEGFRELGKVKKAGITVAINNADDPFNVDKVAAVISNPLDDLTRWQRELNCHVVFDDDTFFEDVIAGKPRRLNKFQVAVSFEHGDKDPFFVIPDDAHTWRGAWRWIKDCFWYPIKLGLGKFTSPYRTLYIINDLELADVPIEPSFSVNKDPQEWDRSQEAFRRHFRFRTIT